MALTPDQARRMRMRRMNLLMAYASFASTKSVTAAPAAFTPSSLFSGGERGAWYDPSDLSSMFQDSAGTTPVTAVEQPVGRINDKSGNNNHATQATAASRPVLRARYNYVLYSEDFSNAVWTKSNCTASAHNVADPIGGTTASTITATAPLGYFFYTSALENLTTQSLCSVWIRRRTGTGGIRVRTSATAPTDTDITGSVTSSWSRLTWNCTPGSVSQNHFVISLATSGDAIDLWHPDYRAATESSTLPNYQRISDAATYDTVGFPQYLAFDGTDDSFATSAIDFSATDKIAVFAGLRKLSDAAQGVIAELTASIALNNGAFLLSAPNSAAANYNFSSKGTTQVDNIVTTYTAPITNVVSGIADIAAPSNVIRVNGTQVGSVAATQGTGNFSNAALNIGQRSGGTLRLNGRLYQMVVIGRTPTASEISDTETFCNTKTGAY